MLRPFFMKIIIYIFWLIIIALAASFSVLNAHVVSIDYYLGTTKLFLPLLILLSVIVGMVLGIFLLLPAWFRAKRQARQAKKLADKPDDSETVLS